MSRSPRLPLLVLAGLALGLASCGRRPDLPHVIVVTLDTTRADFFGSYGRPSRPTPNFDALADDGALFELAVSASAVTPVSHASILTGQYPYRHRLRVLSGLGGYRLPQDVPTLATVLKSRGYRTAAVHSAFPVSGWFGFDRDFDHFDSIEMEMGGKSWDVVSGQRRSDDTTDRVLELLSRKDKPLFLWIHYWDPHDVVLLPPESELPPDLPRTAQGHVAPSTPAYEAELRWTDRQFGRLVRALQDSGHYDRTLFVITSDHGEGLEDGLQRHGWFFHRILYQEQIHVPLIVKPQRSASVRTGVRVPELVRTVDIFPTVLDYLDIGFDAPIDGRSLRPLIEGRPDAPRTAYADQINLWDANAKMLERRPQAAFLHVAMEGTWKLIYRPTSPEDSELYDLASDPLELKNLFGERRDVVQRLARQLVDHRGWVREPFPPDPESSPEQQAQARDTLKGLGYIGSDGDVLARPEHWVWYDVVAREIHPEARPGGIWLPVYTGPILPE